MTTMPLRITGGVDTHLDVHVAAALDHRGGLLGVESFETTPAGYRRLLGWLGAFGEVELVGVEGTGSYGAGLTRHLQSEGVAVVEVDRPQPSASPSARQVRPPGRRHRGPCCAVRRRPRPGQDQRRKRRGHAGIAGRPLVGAQGPHPVSQPDAQHHLHRPRTHPGRAAKPQRVPAPQPRRRLPARSAPRCRVAHQAHVADAGPTRPGPPGRGCRARQDPRAARGPDRPGARDPARHRHRVRLGPARRRRRQPRRLRNEATFAHLCGVAPLDASSGKHQRHRLNRGGDRQANSALWRIVITRMVYDPRTRHYIERRMKEGLTKKEAFRCLERYIAREVYNSLPRSHLALDSP